MRKIPDWAWIAAVCVVVVCVWMYDQWVASRTTIYDRVEEQQRLIKPIKYKRM
jgi:hypothetical protein